jgi:hypothetical protein
MPRFVNISTGDLISTAYKVMYSTLAGTAALQEIDEAEFSRMAAEKIMLRQPLLIIVRNPYARLASFFADKLRKDLERASGSWQFSQLIFFPLVGLTVDDSFETIRQRLKSISFEDFVDYLPHAKANGHLRPQAELLSTGDMNLARNTTAFLMETDLDQLWLRLGVPRQERQNATSSRLDPATLSRGRLDLINKIYAADFEAFGYDFC